MKKFLFFAFVLTLFAACGGSSSTAEEAEVGEAQDAAALVGGAYTADVAKTVINWTGRKFTDDKHSGTLSLSEGSFAVADGNITGGSFTIDMTSIAVTDDMPEDKKGYLVGHLSNGDFFEVETYPTATFTITGVEAIEDSSYSHKLSGNLKMKDIEKEVSFKANVEASEGTVTAISQEFAINRTLWKVEYGSTLLGVAKDKAIKDELELQITLVATAAEEGEEATSEEGDGEEVTEEK